MFLSLAFSFSAFSQKDSVPSQASDTSKTGDVPLLFCSSMPYFDLCKSDSSNKARQQCTLDQIRKIISENFIISKKAKKLGQSGTIYLRFTVNKTGDIVDVKILKGINPELDQAAIDVMKTLPKFNPAMLDNGKPVSIIYSTPIKIDFN